MLTETQMNAEKIKILESHNESKIDMIENLKTEVITVTAERTFQKKELDRLFNVNAHMTIENK